MELREIFSENSLPLSIVAEKKKVKENTIHFVLNVESLEYEEVLRTLLLGSDFRVVRSGYRFPVEGMVSPPPLLTLVIIQTLPPLGSTNEEVETSPPRLLFYYIVITIVIISIQNYYQNELFSDDASITTLVMGLLSVLHILFNRLKRDLKKIK